MVLEVFLIAIFLRSQFVTSKIILNFNNNSMPKTGKIINVSNDQIENRTFFIIGLPHFLSPLSSRNFF